MSFISSNLCRCTSHWSSSNYARMCKGNLTDLGRILHLSLAKGNPK
jgi:hypothetical protein